MTEGPMDELDGLAAQFEASRPRLHAVAYRMLGSAAEADDAIQEAWLRLSRSGGDDLQNLGGWLTTVVGRICLDMLRARKSRREDSLDAQPGDLTAPDPDPESEALLADSVGLAMLVVLDTLSPAERVAFVLHDMFDVPFDQIAGITGRSPAASRQLASRGRRRLGGTPAADGPGLARQREVVEAFLAASRSGDFGALLALLDPAVELHADEAATPPGMASHVVGAVAVSSQTRIFSSRARFARIMLIDGTPGLVLVRRGRVRLALRLTFADGKITTMDVVADPARLSQLTLAVLAD